MLNKKEPEVFTYEEAAAYIEEIPKFTTKNKLEHTRKCLDLLGSPDKKHKIIFKKIRKSGSGQENRPRCRNQWKRVCMCILTGHTYGRGEENRVLYIPSSCICK